MDIRSAVVVHVDLYDALITAADMTIFSPARRHPSTIVGCGMPVSHR